MYLNNAVTAYNNKHFEGIDAKPENRSFHSLAHALTHSFMYAPICHTRFLIGTALSRHHVAPPSPHPISSQLSGQSSQLDQAPSRDQSPALPDADSAACIARIHHSPR